MGGGASKNLRSLSSKAGKGEVDLIDEASCREACGDDFDEQTFRAACDENGCITTKVFFSLVKQLHRKKQQEKLRKQKSTKSVKYPKVLSK